MRPRENRGGDKDRLKVHRGLECQDRKFEIDVGDTEEAERHLRKWGVRQSGEQWKPALGTGSLSWLGPWGRKYCKERRIFKPPMPHRCINKTVRTVMRK